MKALPPPVRLDGSHFSREVVEGIAGEGGMRRQHRGRYDGALDTARRNDGERGGQTALPHAGNVLNGYNSFHIITTGRYARLSFAFSDDHPMAFALVMIARWQKADDGAPWRAVTLTSGKAFAPLG